MLEGIHPRQGISIKKCTVLYARNENHLELGDSSVVKAFASEVCGSKIKSPQCIWYRYGYKYDINTVHTCHPSTPVVRWGSETGESLEVIRSASLIDEAVAKQETMFQIHGRWWLTFKVVLWPPQVCVDVPQSCTHTPHTYTKTQTLAHMYTYTHILKHNVKETVMYTKVIWSLVSGTVGMSGRLWALEFRGSWDGLLYVQTIKEVRTNHRVTDDFIQREKERIK